MTEYIVNGNYEDVTREIRRRIQKYNEHSSKPNSDLKEFFPVFRSFNSYSIPIFNLFPELLDEMYEVSEDLDMASMYYNILVLPYHKSLFPFLSAILLPKVSKKTRIVVHDALLEELNLEQQSTLDNILDTLEAETQVDSLIREVTKGKLRT